MLQRYRIFFFVGLAAVLIWVNLRPPVGLEVVKATERTAAHAALAGPSAPPPTSSSVPALSAVPLSTLRIRPALEAAARDPFMAILPPPLVVTKQAAAPPPPPQVAAPPPPVAPRLGLTFAGRVTAPDGGQVIYVAYGGESLKIAAGQNLPNGYRVDVITASAVELSYPPLNTTARLDLPAPPKYEIR